MSERYVSVRVKGDFALFTRPENKVERVSYPVITPSAARGVLEAIYWHPEFRWAIQEIHVLRPVRTVGILRNEVNSKMSPRSETGFFADEDRSQRHSVILRDVEYVIYADAERKPGKEFNYAKHRDIFRRRVQRGQCYHRPALGCREFAADFGPVEGEVTPERWTQDLGLMLWDMDFSGGKPPYSPIFFEAKIEEGVMKVPDLIKERAS